MNEKYKLPCGGDMCENQPCCEEGLGVRRIKIQPPTGELLPAEERLENALAAIINRITLAVDAKRQMEKVYGTEYSVAYAEQRAFISGLDIAWSLAKTESLRRDG